MIMTAQLFMSSSQQFVEQAVKDGMYVVRQEYQLEDTVTGQRFGRYGNEEFGSFASLVIRTSVGDFFESGIFAPWERDANYDRYRSTHKPLLSRCVMTEIGDTVISTVELSVDRIHPVDSVFSFISQREANTRGFVTKSYNRKTDGWIVWLSGDSTLDKTRNTLMPEFLIYKKSIDFDVDSLGTITVDMPQTPRKLWGGIFVVPECTAIGRLDFVLGGIIVKESGLWILARPFDDIRNSDLDTLPDELTPSDDRRASKKKSKKKNKNNKNRR